MKNFNEKKLELLKSIERLVAAINIEIDWFIASFREKDQKRRRLARNLFYEKRKERMRLAKEAHEQSK